jgi:hypothetical protein
MKLPWITLAENDITGYFDSLTRKVFLKKDIYQMLSEKHQIWGLRRTMSVDTFIEQIKEIGLEELRLTSPNYDNTYTRFIWGKNVPIYQLSLSLRPHSYFTHHSAMHILGLSSQTPTTVYVNSEQSIKYDRDGELEQERINMAFKRKPRTSKYIFTYKNQEICCLNGINTKKLGVEEIKVFKEGKLPVTNIERTLIDITVRPVYSGGCKEVLEAYRRAKNKISVDTLITMLQKINYIYPYHQAIGFYMQTAGFDESDFNKLKKLGLRYDFYLDYDMKKTKYSKEWRIYYPKNL